MTSFSYRKIHCRSAAVIGDLPIYAADFQLIICVQATQRGFRFKKLCQYFLLFFFSDTKLLQIAIEKNGRSLRSDFTWIAKWNLHKTCAVYPNRVQERIVMHLHNCILWQISEGVSYLSLMESFYYTHHTDQK